MLSFSSDDTAKNQNRDAGVERVNVLGFTLPTQNIAKIRGFISLVVIAYSLAKL
jgi:hypothetical protein